MSWKILLPIITALLCVLPATALADVVILKTGVEKEGVIIQEDENEIRLQTKVGTIGFTRDLIETIIRVPEAENNKLLLRWEREKQLRELERMERLKRLRAFEAEQRARGLVKYKREWMTPVEADARMRAEAAERGRLAREAAPVPPTAPQQEKELAVPQDPMLKLISVVASMPRRSSARPEFAVNCRIANRAFRDAASVTIRLICYGDEGEEVATVEARSRPIPAGGRSNLRVMIPVRLADVAGIEARAVEVQWR